MRLGIRYVSERDNVKGGNKTSMAGRNVRVISSLNKRSMSSRNNIRKKLRVMRHINTTSRVKILSVT